VDADNKIANAKQTILFIIHPVLLNIFWPKLDKFLVYVNFKLR
jgi:hypothetical protein